MRGAIFGVATLGFMMISALLFVLMGVVFFFINVWIIKVGAGIAGFKALSGDWVILTAGILTAASVISSALKR